jgi:hypothetical protein
LPIMPIWQPNCAKRKLLNCRDGPSGCVNGRLRNTLI